MGPAPRGAPCLPVVDRGAGSPPEVHPMNHGRDHQEREQKIGVGRTRNTPESDSDEAALLAAGRTRGAPPGYGIGAQGGRLASATPGGGEPVADGAEVAPTAKAAEREQARHREERKRGRMAAGVGENER